jgi:hypothetical protein
VKLHKPVKIIEKKKEISIFDLDALVKEYMFEKGVIYVRGGSYIHEHLSEEAEQFLYNELSNAENEYPDPIHDHSYKELIDLYFCKTWTLLEIEQEKKRIIENFEKYKKENAKYKQIFNNDPIDTKSKKSMQQKHKTNHLNITHLHDIEWLRNYCTSVHNESSVFIDHKCRYEATNPNNKKYIKMLPVLKHVYRMYLKYSNSKSDVEYLYPRFMLDDFFYHRHRVHLPFIQDQIDAFCNAYRLFTLYVLNRIDECAYDICTWNYDIEWQTSRSIYMLETLKQNQIKEANQNADNEKTGISDSMNSVGGGRIVQF